MNKESDKLQPLRRIDQSRDENQANDGQADDTQQPDLGRGNWPNELHRASEHLQHKQLPPETLGAMPPIDSTACGLVDGDNPRHEIQRRGRQIATSRWIRGCSEIDPQPVQRASRSDVEVIALATPEGEIRGDLRQPEFADQ